MIRFTVETAATAEADIIESFIWGCETWRVDKATAWANDLRTSILENLSTFPLKYPIAPEHDGSGREYRQMLMGRYRVIFYVEGQVVSVLHITGAFVN